MNNRIKRTTRTIIYAVIIISLLTAGFSVTADNGEVESFNIVFHDMLPDGTEKTNICISVQKGTQLSDIDDVVFEDGTNISECVWSTLADGVKAPLSLSDHTVSESIDLYTYSYELNLSHNPVEFNIPSVMLVSREGKPINASDFIVNGKDLSCYLWTFVDNSGVTQTLDVSNIIANGLTENIVASTNGVLNIPDVTPTPNHFVDFYIFIDGKRILLKSQNITSYKIQNRHYLSADMLEAVYGDFGFEASSLVSGTRYFPHTNFNRPNIWADTSVAVINGYAFSPVTTTKDRVEVYYLPHQTLGSTNAAWANILSGGNETFYSVSVQDYAQLVYSPSELPQPVYTLNGDSATITVSNIPRTETDDFIVSCRAADNLTISVEATDNQDGLTTFVIPNISRPYVISYAPDSNSAFINYSINLPKVPIDSEYGTPTISGVSTLNIKTEENETTHSVLSPDLIYYLYDAGEKYLGRATFTGWAINGNTDPEALIMPDETLNLADYFGAVSLEAQWHTDFAGRTKKIGSMVNFYVSLAAHPDLDDHWQGNIEAAQFTESVYIDNCGVDAGIVPTKELYANSYNISGNFYQYHVLGSTSGDNITSRHNMIVRELSRGYTMRGNDGLDYTFQTSFPSDDMVMRNIRDMIAKGTSTIIINGHTVTPDEMNAENFSVRWYVFKYDTSDGWHIDGVLVSKVGTMVITKTFDGSEDIIQAVKNNTNNGGYHIDVSTTPGAIHTGGILDLSNAVSYSPATKTYTWELSVDQFYEYTIIENNYISNQLPDQSLTTTYADYDIRNSKQGYNTQGWQSYSSSGVTVMGQTNYDNNTRKLTVCLLNTYTEPGTLVFRKTDSRTGHSISNIYFDATDSNNSPLALYDDGNGYYELVPSNNSQSTLTNTIKTNYAGQAFLLLPTGTYKFKERVPEGYEDPGVITVNMIPDPQTKQKAVIGSATASNGPQYIKATDESLILIVKNHSITFDLTVEKIWIGDENKPVTLQLYLEGQMLDDPIIFDGTVDSAETEAWKHIYANLPLFVDGHPATYTIKENRIGNLLYSPDEPDGYLYYNVDITALQYKDAFGQSTDNILDATTASLCVTNSRNIGNLTLKKVDEKNTSLSGAVFKLYNADNFADVSPREQITENNFIRSVQSDEDGFVHFGTIFDGSYYLVESDAPTGYLPSDALYRIRAVNGVVSLERLGSGNTNWLATPDHKIINRLNSVSIKKQVSGLMGDHNKLFGFVVTSTEKMALGNGYTLSNDGYTATFSLKHNDTVNLFGIPVGAKLTITETNSQGYETSILVGETEMNGAITVGAETEIVVINQTNYVPDTGILLDSLPYILILSAVILGAVIIILRKRRSKDDE